jgi:hypothetical protein
VKMKFRFLFFDGEQSGFLVATIIFPEKVPPNPTPQKSPKSPPKNEILVNLLFIAIKVSLFGLKKRERNAKNGKLLLFFTFQLN